MKPSPACYDIIKKFEGLRLRAYLDQVGVPTIGWGSTFYRDGSRVKMGDVITIEKAQDLLDMVMENVSDRIGRLVIVELNQNQFDALTSFGYNIGMGNFKKSTLLRKANINPNDRAIRLEFMKWTKGRIDGELTHLPGLELRRKREADLYFKPITQ